jgi:hypothetical protein
MKLSEIYEGWKNHLSPSKYLKEKIAEVSAKRLEICRSCPFHSSFHTTGRPDEHCTDCGCTLLPKTKCLSCSCPQNKWGAEISAEEQNDINYETDFQD